MYILKCSDGTYYTGSTNDIDRRLWEHQNSLGANYTKKRLPVELVYFEEYSRIDEAFYREKEIQGWSRRKKEALINGENNLLPDLAKKVFRDVAVASIQSPSDDHSATGINEPVVECFERSEKRIETIGESKTRS
jgi:putative endonuclease